MKKAGVIGWPLQHTKSPVIHGHWLKKYEVAGSYDAVPIAPGDLKSGVKKLVDAGYAGFNITVPHKQAIMDHLDFISPEAERIGAVNMVVIGADGRMEGRNTDAFGFIENLKDGAPGFKFDKPAVVLGAGGASRAIVYALQREGIRDIHIVNRTPGRARELADAFGVDAHGWNDLPALLKDAGLLVNATTLGMEGQPALDIDLAPLASPALVCDIVYTPLETNLLRDARKTGHATVNGIGMLLHQARPSFEAWFGILPDVDDELTRKVLV